MNTRLFTTSCRPCFSDYVTTMITIYNILELEKTIHFYTFKHIINGLYLPHFSTSRSGSNIEQPMAISFCNFSDCNVLCGLKALGRTHWVLLPWTVVLLTLKEIFHLGLSLYWSNVWHNMLHRQVWLCLCGNPCPTRFSASRLSVWIGHASGVNIDQIYILHNIPMLTK